MKYGRTEYGRVWHELEPAFFAKETGWTLTTCGIDGIAEIVDTPIDFTICTNCLVSNGATPEHNALSREHNQSGN